MVVPVKDTINKGAWSFTEPLAANLWFASFTFFVFTGIVVWALEHKINDEFRGTPTNQIGTVFYFSFSTLVFSHREAMTSNLSRVVVIIWIFVVLILTQSYTASLTSILTVQQLQPTVTDLNDLLKNGASVGYVENSFIPDLLKEMKFNSSQLIALSSPQQFYEAFSNGSVAAIVDEIPYLKVFLSQHCDKYTMVGPTYKSDGFGFAFPIGSPLVPDISRKILEVIEKRLTDLDNKLYGNYTCADKGDVTATSSSRLSVKSFWGLFLITGVTSVLAVLLHLVLFVYEHRDKLQSQDELENTFNQKHRDKLHSQNTFNQKLALFAKLYTQKSNPDRSPQEIDKDELVMGETVASPDTLSGLQSPSTMSSYTHSNFVPEDEIGLPLDGEGTPGREISVQNPDPPSFADMLRQRLA